MDNRLCEKCGQELEYVLENEPYNAAYLICDKCDSTYILENT